MNRLKKEHLIYALISVSAVIAYSGFMIHNAIRQVDIVEETLPYPYEEDFVSEIVTEPLLLPVSSPPVEEVEKVLPTEEILPTEEPTEGGFYPVLPVKGTVIKPFSEKHIYNEITRDWRNHTGLDISASAAERVFAIEDGTVRACYKDALWGNVIEIDHGEYISVYKNLSTLDIVSEGDSVNKGDTISGVGDGCTAEKLASPHLHFELLHFGKYIDPASLID